MKSKLRLLLTFGLTLAPSLALANFMEIGGSATFRKSSIDVNAYDQTQSLTGSLAYYFDESSAIELSYTSGYDKQAILEGQPNGHITILNYQAVGLDFIYTFGGAQDSFRPYLKGGVSYLMQKELINQYWDSSGNLFPSYTLETSPTLVPSFGAGFKIAITSTIFLKAGIDFWGSEAITDQPVTFDYAWRAGLSWLF